MILYWLLLLWVIEKLEWNCRWGVPEKVGGFLLWPFLTFFGENLAVKWRQLSNKEMYQIYFPPQDIIHWRVHGNYIWIFMSIIVIIDFGNSVQAISIPHNLLNYTHFWLTFITHNITIYTPRISWSLILCCCKNPLISRVTKVLNDAAPESHWKNQKFPTAEKYCRIRNVPPSNWTTLGRRTPSAKVQHSVVVAQHRDNCFSMRPLHYCCRCTV